MEFLDATDAGVAGPEPARAKDGSEFCRSLWDRLKRSPKLLRPVDVDVRVEAVGRVGVCNVSSDCTFCKEFMVDDRLRRPSFARVGEDFAEAEDSFRRSVCPPGPALGTALPGIATNDINCCASADCDVKSSPEAETGLVIIGTADTSEPGLWFNGEILVDALCGGGDNKFSPFVFCGNGNKGAGFFRRDRRKNVVVVETVCVVVVV